MTALKLNSVSLADLTKQKKQTRNSKTEYLKLSSESRKRKKKVYGILQENQYIHYGSYKENTKKKC